MSDFTCWTQDQFDELAVGDTIRRFYNEGNPNNRVMHVRGLVDGGAVVRTWRKRRQSWHYEVFFFHELFGCDRRER